jgi:hypothetical protein
MAGAIYSFDYDGPLPEDWFGLLRVCYSRCQMAFLCDEFARILQVHEFGHYLLDDTIKTS